jgi:hypothetical protein
MASPLSDPLPFPDATVDTINAALSRGDRVRRAPRPFEDPGGHKEWFHFCIYGDGFDLLINFSLVDELHGAPPNPGPRAPRHEAARLTILVREQRWIGEVDRYPAAEVWAPAGSCEIVMGDNRMRWGGGVYHLRAKLRDLAVEVDLVLRPVTMPSIIHNVAVRDGPPINWLVIPRLLASGVLRVEGREHRFGDVPAYHDHNWGRFRWGRDFAWEWGFGLPRLPSNPWSFVFVRLSDRAHTRVMMQGVFLWRGAREQRVLRGSEFSVTRVGLLRQAQITKMPRAMALIAPGTAIDVPERLILEANTGDTRFTATFTSHEAAQVIIPNDDDLGVTIINEVAGSLRVRGCCRGEDFTIECPTIFEFLGA